MAGLSPKAIDLWGKLSEYHCDGKMFLSETRLPVMMELAAHGIIKIGHQKGSVIFVKIVSFLKSLPELADTAGGSNNG